MKGGVHNPIGNQSNHGDISSLSAICSKHMTLRKVGNEGLKTVLTTCSTVKQFDPAWREIFWSCRALTCNDVLLDNFQVLTVSFAATIVVLHVKTAF